MTRRAALAAAVLLSAVPVSACVVTPRPDAAAFARDTSANSMDGLGLGFDETDALVLPLVQDRQTSGPSCGAHALASVVNYWKGPGALDGEALFQSRPPASPSGYSIGELLDLAHGEGLLASGVELPSDAVIRELENGRPVLVPVRLPSIYVQQRTAPDGDVVVLDAAKDVLIGRAARVSEWTRLALLDHYLLLVGYADDTFVVLEPVMGYRTVDADKLDRFRRPFGDAAVVFSLPPGVDRAAADVMAGEPPSSEGPG
jgi:hypothetical protein